MWRRRRKQLGAKPMRISYRTWTVIALAVRPDHSTMIWISKAVKEIGRTTYANWVQNFYRVSPQSSHIRYIKYIKAYVLIHCLNSWHLEHHWTSPTRAGDDSKPWMGSTKARCHRGLEDLHGVFHGGVFLGEDAHLTGGRTGSRAARLGGMLEV